MLGGLFQESSDSGEGSPVAETGLATSSDRAFPDVPEPPLSRGPTAFAGLENQSTTCYLNSVIQALYMTREFRAGLFAVDPRKELNVGLLEAALDADPEERGEASRAALAIGGVEEGLGLVEKVVEGKAGTGAGTKAQAEAKADSSEMELKSGLCGDSGSSSSSSSSSGGGGTAAAPSSPSKGKAVARAIPLELQNLFSHLQSAKLGCCSTVPLTTRGFGWGADSGRGRVQHDVSELTTKLLDKVEQYLAGTSGDSLVRRILKGRQRYVTACTDCGTVSARSEEFALLTLPVMYYTAAAEEEQEEEDDEKEEEEEENKKKKKRKRAWRPPVRRMHKDICSSLKSYVAFEKLEGDNQYQCDACQGKRDALRGIELQELPPLLLLGLNRYTYDPDAGGMQRLRDRVDWPLVLDMRPYLGDAAGVEAEMKRRRITEGARRNSSFSSPSPSPSPSHSPSPSSSPSSSSLSSSSSPNPSRPAFGGRKTFQQKEKERRGEEENITVYPTEVTNLSGATSAFRRSLGLRCLRRRCEVEASSAARERERRESREGEERGGEQKEKEKEKKGASTAVPRRRISGSFKGPTRKRKKPKTTNGHSLYELAAVIVHRGRCVSYLSTYLSISLSDDVSNNAHPTNVGATQRDALHACPAETPEAGTTSPTSRTHGERACGVPR